MNLTEKILAARPYILAALERDGLHEESDVINLIRTGRAQLWNGEKSAAVTMVEEYPLGRTLLIWLAGGDLDELRDEVLPKIEAWGLATQCQEVTIWGRKGWVRALKDQDYAPTITVLRKVLHERQRPTEDRDDHAVGYV